MGVFETHKQLVKVIESVSGVKFVDAIKEDVYRRFFAVTMVSCGATNNAIIGLLKCQYSDLFRLQYNYYNEPNNKTQIKLEKLWEQWTIY